MRRCAAVPLLRGWVAGEAGCGGQKTSDDSDDGLMFPDVTQSSTRKCEQNPRGLAPALPSKQCPAVITSTSVAVGCVRCMLSPPSSSRAVFSRRCRLDRRDHGLRTDADHQTMLTACGVSLLNNSALERKHSATPSGDGRVRARSDIFQSWRHAMTHYHA